MSSYTEEQVEEIVQEAVGKTERSFGGTFKRLKSENEELKTAYEKAVTEHEEISSSLEKKIAELDSTISGNNTHISELAVRGELQKQLKEKIGLPERFLDAESIEYSDDPETLSNNVAEAIEKGRKEFELALSEHGIPIPQSSSAGNPTNPPTRDTTTAHSLKNVEAKGALKDMVRRGLLR